MAYDCELARRIGELIDAPFVERRMFGGLAFLVDGRMAITASGEGGSLVRVDPDESDGLMAIQGVERAVMHGREMRGWLRVSAGHLEGEDLATWVRRGIAASKHAQR